MKQPKLWIPTAISTLLLVLMACRTANLLWEKQPEEVRDVWTPHQCDLGEEVKATAQIVKQTDYASGTHMCEYKVIIETTEAFKDVIQPVLYVREVEGPVTTLEEWQWWQWSEGSAKIQFDGRVATNNTAPDAAQTYPSLRRLVKVAAVSTHPDCAGLVGDEHYLASIGETIQIQGEQCPTP